MIAYGDITYLKEWAQLLTKVGDYVVANAGISDFSYGWCGHIAHYSSDSTSAAIQRVSKKKEKAILIPVLVAQDEMFQIKIIGDGIARIKNNKDKVIYKPDAILPDTNIVKWIIDITAEQVNKINESKHTP